MSNTRPTSNFNNKGVCNTCINVFGRKIKYTGNSELDKKMELNAVLLPELVKTI